MWLHRRSLLQLSTGEGGSGSQLSSGKTSPLSTSSYSDGLTKPAQAAGAVLFAANIIGWYLYAALIFPSVDFPLALPLGDLSTVIPGLNDLRKGDSGSRRRPLLSLRKNKPADIEDAV